MAAVRNRTIALLITLLVLAGCSRANSDPGPTASIPTGVASPTAAPTESPSPDPYAIPADPADIDKAYVERIIEALNEGVVAATRLVRTNQKITPAVAQALSATHLPTSQEGYLRSFREVLRDKAATLQLRADASSVDVLNVKKIITANDGCLFALVRQDTSGLSHRRVRPFDVYYHLEAAESPLPQRNPTPWMVAADARPRTDGREFRDPCADM